MSKPWQSFPCHTPWCERSIKFETIDGTTVPTVKKPIRTCEYCGQRYHLRIVEVPPAPPAVRMWTVLVDKVCE